MKATLRLACIALLIATAIAAYALLVIGTGETLSAPAVDEAQASYLTPAAAETLAMYAPPDTAVHEPGPLGRRPGREHLLRWPPRASHHGVTRNSPN